MISLIVGYASGMPFDRAYYLNTHIPLVDEQFRPLGMQGYEVDELLPGLDGSAPPYQIVFRVFFDTLESLQAALAQAGAVVLADIPNYYAGQPDMFVGNRIGAG